MNYAPWGNFPIPRQQQVKRLFWRDEPLPASGDGSTLLPYGLGRSYGDSCVNEGGTLVDVSGLNRFIAFDPDAGVLRCEAGVSHHEILGMFAPHGWFLPVTPGTRFVTVGGSIANDIHGKNHHRAGTFGCHVLRFELVRSDGSRLICSPTQHGELFRATIGGLGLTGLITWAEIRMRRFPGPLIERESVKLHGLDEFFDLTRTSDEQFEYTVAWIDCLASGSKLGRGIFFRGNHAAAAEPGRLRPREPWLDVPAFAPEFLLTSGALRAFNTLYYHRQRRELVRDNVPYDTFFYPLDAVRHWNRLYGRRGFLQHQSVVPHDGGVDAVREMLTLIAASGEGSFLAVLKVFGDEAAPGLLSFPQPGLTLALDFPHRGAQTLGLLDRLDEIVLRAAGRVYPAKDARMAPATFRAGFPDWEAFAEHVDPGFSSSFWRRVTSAAAERP